MKQEQFRDQPPSDDRLTAYDRAHVKLYLRLLDAESEGADWKEVVEVLFGIDPDADPSHAAAVYTSHLARAKWMADRGFTSLLLSNLH